MKSAVLLVIIAIISISCDKKDFRIGQCIQNESKDTFKVMGIDKRHYRLKLMNTRNIELMVFLGRSGIHIANKKLINENYVAIQCSTI